MQAWQPCCQSQYMCIIYSTIAAPGCHIILRWDVSSTSEHRCKGVCKCPFQKADLKYATHCWTVFWRKNKYFVLKCLCSLCYSDIVQKRIVVVMPNDQNIIREVTRPLLIYGRYRNYRHTSGCLPKFIVQPQSSNFLLGIFWLISTCQKTVGDVIPSIIRLTIVHIKFHKRKSMLFQCESPVSALVSCFSVIYKDDHLILAMALPHT